MTDITDLMMAYRECSRNLWNVYFATKEIGCALDAFEDIRRILFDALVADDLFYEGTAEGAKPPALRVVPQPRAQFLIAAAHAPDESTYWGEGRDLVIEPDDIVLGFIDYFDFSNIGRREFQYYRCKILSFQKHLQFEGREALLAVSDGRVFHDIDHDDSPLEA